MHQEKLKTSAWWDEEKMHASTTTKKCLNRFKLNKLDRCLMEGKCGQKLQRVTPLTGDLDALFKFNRVSLVHVRSELIFGRQPKRVAHPSNDNVQMRHFTGMH